MANIIFGALDKRERHSGKRNKRSMATMPEFAAAYSKGKSGRRYFDFNKGYALAREYFEKEGDDSHNGKMLWARSKGAFNNYAKFKGFASNAFDALRH